MGEQSVVVLPDAVRAATGLQLHFGEQQWYVLSFTLTLILFG